MEPWDAFDLTLKIFDIKAVDISKITGIAETTISDFRNKDVNLNKGREVKAGKFVQLIRAMPTSAQFIFWGLCQSPTDVVTKFEQLVSVETK